MFVKGVPVVHVNYSLPWSDRPTQLNWFWKCSEFLNWPQLWSSPLSFVLSLALRSLLLSRTMDEKFSTFCACRFKYYIGSKIITSLLCGNFCACRRYGFLGLFSSLTIVLASIRSFRVRLTDNFWQLPFRITHYMTEVNIWQSSLLLVGRLWTFWYWTL